jgi:hypothetical protein
MDVASFLQFRFVDALHYIIFISSKKFVLFFYGNSCKRLMQNQSLGIGRKVA